MNVKIEAADQKRLLDLQALLEQRIGTEVTFSRLFSWLLNVGAGILSGKMIFVPVADFDRDAAECATAERSELAAAVTTTARQLVPGFECHIDEGDEIVIVCTLDKGKATGKLAASRNGTQH